ncbi:hypothetical protein [Solibacillus sp. NPDC093137]|uniref:hypothetical protein n=1 Tax=Solibacillus sp. NPDC093137 TaxID=3390678 RepID=UPI003D040CD8
MFTEMLWWYGVKHQYDLQREAGAAGFFALLSVIGIALGWDSIFYPLLETFKIIDMLEIGGLIVPERGGIHIQSAINILAFFVFICLCIGILTALPMAIVLVFFSILGLTNENSPKAVRFIIGMVFLPFVLIASLITKFLRLIGVMKKENSFQAYVHGNEQLKEVYYGEGKKASFITKNAEVNKDDYFKLYSAQQGNALRYEEVSLEEATKILNKAVPSLERNDEFLVGYHAMYEQWVMLFPNPVPVFASETILDKRPEATPFNYEELSTAQLAHKLNPHAPKPKFHVPATAVKIQYDYVDKKIICGLPMDSFAQVACLDSLSKIAKISGSDAKKMYEIAIQKVGVRSLVNKAHTYAYLIPLAYPMEMSKFMDNSCVNSYYKALQDVPNVQLLAETYKDSVITELGSKSRNGHLWAKEVLHNMESN